MKKYGISININRDESLSEHAKKLLKDFYMLPEEESPQEAYARASVAWSGGDMALAQRLYDYTSKNYFVFASPVLSNAPAPGSSVKGLPISCFLTYVGDSLHSLIDHTTEERWLSVKGGGVGGHWSDVRAVSDIAPGPIPFLHTIDSDMVAYKQGRTRKGSYAAYLDVSHPDIVEFIGIRTPTGDVNRKCLNLHHAVNITDAFMECVKSGKDWRLVDPKTREIKSKMPARKLWEAILETRYRTGEPYINFIDTANAALPAPLKKLGLKLHGSNLCVAPETRILTMYGYKTISELKDQEVFVWNGKTWSCSIVEQTSTGSELIKVTFSSGSELWCTKYHKFYIQNTYSKNFVVKSAEELVLGDKLRKEEFGMCSHSIEPLEFNSYWYTSGFFTGDGCAYKNNNHIDLYHKKIELKQFMEYHKELAYSSVQKRQRILIDNSHIKFHVPFDRHIHDKLSWLAGLLDADGTVARNGTNESIQITSINHDFLIDLMLFLQELGINSKVLNQSEGGEKMLPDGRGGSKLYPCKQSWRLVISSSSLFKLMELGLPLKRLKTIKRKPQRNAEQFVYVTNIEITGRRDATFCCTEHTRNTIFLEGVPTGNCNEIHLPTNEERTAVCCLSSLNLEYYDEWNNSSIVSDLIRMLDNVLEYFISNAPKELAKAAYSAKRERSIGLGAMGFHSLLQRKGIAFETEEARTINESIFKEIKEKAVKESQRLAHERGEAPDMAGTGLRHSHLLAVAPNANSSIIADTSPSIEPWHSNAFVHRTRAGSYLSKNKYLEKELEKHGLNNDNVWSNIISSSGSVASIEGLNESTKAIFKTAMEINQEWVIHHAADRQKHICQGQSVNLFFSSNAGRAYINNIHIAAWNRNLKGLYYLRTEASTKAENIGSKVTRVALKDAEPEVCSIENAECKACEG